MPEWGGLGGCYGFEGEAHNTCNGPIQEVVGDLVSIDYVGTNSFQCHPCHFRNGRDVRNVCEGTVNPPIDTVSFANVPCTAPEPYLISTGECGAEDMNEDDLDESYSGVPDGQAAHCVDASQRSLDPVSKMTLNVWALMG